MDIQDCQHRDLVIRAYLEGRTWDDNPEFALLRELVVRGHELLADVPLVYDYEWESVSGRSDLGRGDLIFTDGVSTFAVVEVKYIDDRSGKTARTKRNKSRGLVKEQAREYTAAMVARHGDMPVSVRAYAYTNTEGMLLVTYE